MKFSIITPTLQRDSLRRCVESVVSQSHKDREHIIALDGDTLNSRLLEECFYPRQTWVTLGKRYGNFGNHARHEAWKYATGDFIVMLDDDNYLADATIIEDMAQALQGIAEQWAIFPIHRHGRPFFYDPPGCCYVDTANMVLRREIGRWPDIVAREADGHFCDELKLKYPYKAFPAFRPIIVMEKSSDGV